MCVLIRKKRGHADMVDFNVLRNSFSCYIIINYYICPINDLNLTFRGRISVRIKLRIYASPIILPIGRK
jgi:hypothetical protein